MSYLSILHSNIRIVKSYMKITDKVISDFTETVSDITDFETLPEDYSEFLKEYNGGFIESDGSVLFETEIPNVRMNANQSGSLLELYGINFSNQSGRVVGDLNLKNQRFYDEQFLPTNVIAVGYCEGGSLLCMSLNKNDFGALYYWEYLWNYPEKFFGDFFDSRIQKVIDEFPDSQKILNDREHPKYFEVFNRLNYATLGFTAGSFREFIKKLYVSI